jgi:hypothetical protein
VVALARDDQRRARLAATARRFVVEHHDATAVGDQLARLIDEVAATGSPKRV